MWFDRDLYDQSYFDKNYQYNPKRYLSYFHERNRVYAEFLQNHETIGGTALDIGCGTGDFLRMFDDCWDKYGVEPSEYASSQARRKGISIIDIKNAPPCDLIVFRGTLQHINNPMEPLWLAVNLLKEDGLLAILATPDTDSLVYKLWGNLPPLDAPRNWVLFGHRMLANILDRMGMETRFSYPYWETPYARPVADFSRFAFSLVFGYRPFAFPGNMMECMARKKNNEKA